MGAQVRFFVVVGPKVDREDWWPNVSYDYLNELRTVMSVRAITIGGGYLALPQNDPQWSHWRNVEDLFTAPLEPDFANVVCAPPHLMLGQRRTRGQMSPPASEIPELRNIEQGHPGNVPMVHAQMTATRGDPNEVMYEPNTALCTLHTHGRVNVAITGVYPEVPGAEELRMLRRYTVVIAASPEAARALNEHEVAAVHVAPDRFGAVLRSLVSGV